MQQHHHNVALAVPDDGFISNLEEMFPNVNIFIIPIVRNIKLINDIKTLISLIHLFKKQKFNIIHLHTPKAGLLGSIAGRLLLHQHIIFHLHGFVSLKFNQLRPGLTLLMERVPLLLSHKVLCVSGSLKKLCINNRLISPKQIFTLNNGSINGIDFSDKFNPERLAQELTKLEIALDTKNKFTVGFLGRINKDKGFFDIIETIKILSKKIDNLMMIFVGPNEMTTDINTYLAENLNCSFKYFPRTNQPELFISLFDVMLFPSYREGFGLVAAEANALRVPVVAYDIVGMQDSIAHNETGLLVEPGNIKALATSIFFYEKQAEIRKQHGINGRNRVIKLFSPEQVWSAQLNFYEGLLNESSDQANF